MISEIAIKNVLPEVFSGDGEEKYSSQSQVWLHDVTFRKGEKYTIAARSGAGKSSLCSFIYGNRTAKSYLMLIALKRLTSIIGANSVANHWLIFHKK